MATLVDLGPALTKKKTGLIDLGPAPTPIMEAIQEVEAPAQEVFDPDKPIPFREDIIPPTGIPEIADPQDVTVAPITTPTKRPRAKPFDLGILEIGKAIRELIAPTTPYTEKEATRAYKEIPRTLENVGMRALTLGGLAGPLMGLKPSELRAALDEDIRESAGFAPALAPALGETTLLAIEWGYLYPKLFKAVGVIPRLISKIPGVSKGAKALKSLGGIEKLATKYPRLYNKVSKVLGAFTKGATVGTIVALPEALGEELPAGEVLKHTGKSAAIMGGIAMTFQALSQVDTARYVKQLRNSLIKASNQRFSAKIAELKSTFPPRQANEAIKGLTNTKRLELQQIDNIVSAAEAQLIGLKSGKLYQKGQGMVESPQRAAERFIRQGMGAGKPFKGEPLLKKGLGATKPFIEMPTTRAGEVREAVTEAAKAVRHPVEAVRKAVGRIPKVGVPAAPKVVTPPPVKAKLAVKVTPQKRQKAIDFVKGILKQEQYVTLDEKARTEIGRKMLAEQGVEVKAAELVVTPPTKAIVAPEPTPKPITPEKAVEVPIKPVVAKPKGEPKYQQAKKDFERMVSKATPQEIEKAKVGYEISSMRFARQYLEPKENQELYNKIYNIYSDYFEKLTEPVAGRKAEIAPVTQPEVAVKAIEWEVRVGTGKIFHVNAPTHKEARVLAWKKVSGKGRDVIQYIKPSEAVKVAAEAKVEVEKEVEKEIKDVEKEAITEPTPSPEVEPREARELVPTGKLDPTNAEEALEIIDLHAQFMYREKGVSVGGIFEQKYDAKTKRAVITSVEYTTKQVDTAYRTIQKPVESPMPDTELFAMPGKEAQVKAIAQKMAKVKGVVKPKKVGPKPLTKPTALPKAKTKIEDHIKAVYVAAAKDDTRYAINGVKVEGDTIIATDGRRMFLAKGKWGKDGVYMNPAALKKGLLGKVDKTDKKFPKWQDIMPDVSSQKPILVEDLDTVLRHVRQAASMTSEESKGVLIIENKDGSLGFSAAAPEVGHVEINVMPGSKILGAVNPTFFMDAIKFHAIRGNSAFEFYFSDPTRVMLTKSLDGKTSTLTMPVNIEKSAKDIAEAKAISEGKKAEVAKGEKVKPEKFKELRLRAALAKDPNLEREITPFAEGWQVRESTAEKYAELEAKVIKAEAKPKAAKVKPKKKSKAEVAKAIKEHYTPGNIVYVQYWGTHDRIIEFKETDTGFLVKVQKVKKQDGKWVAVGDVRTHMTAPSRGDKVVERAAPIKPKGKPGFVDLTPIADLGKALIGDIEIEPVLEVESSSFNKHLDYFQGRQLPKTSQVRKIQKQMQIVNGQRLAGTITTKSANVKIRQLRKLLLETAKKEGIALRITKGGKVSVAVRKAGTYVPVEFAEYTKFKDVSPVFGGGQDITRAIQQMDGSLTIRQKVREPGQAGQLEQNVLWPTREMSLQKLMYLREKTAELKSIFNIRRKSKVDKQINLVLEKIASQDRDVPIKKILSDKTLRSIASPDVIRQAVKLRTFYDTLIDEQNIARKIRGQKEIPYRRKYSPHILRDATIWERVMMKGKKAEDVFGKGADLPDYIRPNKPFNPREMAREGGIPYEKRIISSRELAEIYLVTAGKDIFNTSIIQNNKAFIQQLEAMDYKKSANYLADWTAEAYAGIKPRLDRVVGLPAKAQKAALWFNRLRNMAVFPLNFAWNLTVQPSSLALTIGRYGTKNTFQGFLQWLVPSVRRRTAKDYYSYIVKASKQGKITKQDARNLIGSDVKLKMTTGEVIENIGGFFTNQLEKLLTGTSIRAARLHGKKRGLTGEALKNYASDGGAKTQSMYNDEDKPALLRNLTVKTAAPYQTFAYEVMNTMREWAGRTGTPPDTKLYRIWTILRFLAAASVFAMIAKKLAKRDVWNWKRPPIPFAEFWLSPIIRIFSKEYIGGSGSGLTSPVETAQRVAKGIDDVLETGNWRKLRNELIKYGPGIFGIPGGVQISRTVDAIIAYSKGGIRDKRGRLMFKMEDPQDLAQAVFSGVWTTKGGQEYLGKRTGTKQTGTRKKRLERKKEMLR